MWNFHLIFPPLVSIYKFPISKKGPEFFFKLEEKAKNVVVEKHLCANLSVFTLYLICWRTGSQEVLVFGYFDLCPWNYGGDDFRGGGFLEKLKIEMPLEKNPVYAPAPGWA